MGTVFALLAVTATAIVVVVFGAALTALAIYTLIMVCVWLWQKADEKYARKGGKLSERRKRLPVMPSV